jgi:hypothetical protein
MQTPLTLETALLLLEGQRKLLDCLLEMTQDIRVVLYEDKNYILRTAALLDMADAIKTNRDELTTYLRSTPDQKGLSHD